MTVAVIHLQDNTRKGMTLCDRVIAVLPSRGETYSDTITDANCPDCMQVVVTDMEDGVAKRRTDEVAAIAVPIGTDEGDDDWNDDDDDEDDVPAYVVFLTTKREQKVFGGVYSDEDKAIQVCDLINADPVLSKKVYATWDETWLDAWPEGLDLASTEPAPLKAKKEKKA